MSGIKRMVRADRERSKESLSSASSSVPSDLLLRILWRQVSTGNDMLVARQNVFEYVKEDFVLFLITDLMQN